MSNSKSSDWPIIIVTIIAILSIVGIFYFLGETLEPALSAEPTAEKAQAAKRYIVYKRVNIDGVDCVSAISSYSYTGVALSCDWTNKEEGNDG